jgi:hypothetical protein
MVRVCCSKVAVVGVPCERTKSSCSATSSSANRCLASASAGLAQRYSILRLRPSVHPSLWRPSRNASTSARPSGSISACAINTPIRRIARPERAHGERPSRRRTAEQRDELAPIQLIELHSVPCQPDCRLPNFSVRG